MAITDENGGNGFFMPVAPAYSGGYGNNGGFFGGDWAWIILLLLIGGNGWGMGGFGMGGMMPWLMGGGMGGGFGIDYLYPWLNNSQHMSDGFRDQYLNTQIDGLRTDVNRGFGDVQLAMSNGFNAAEIAANGRQMANMQTAFGLQSQLAQCCCDNKAGLADLKYTIAAEECATRQANAADTQRVLDKLCQLELDGVKGQLAAKDDIIAQLRQENLYARGQASQIAQSSDIINGVYNRLSQCPVGSTPVYGNQPIFTCQRNNACGCGCNGQFAA